MDKVRVYKKESCLKDWLKGWQNELAGVQTSQGVVELKVEQDEEEKRM